MFKREISFLINLIITLALPQSLFACTVCFGNPEDPSSKGVAAGVLLLMGVVGFVLAAIAGTAYYWSRKAKDLNLTEKLV